MDFLNNAVYVHLLIHFVVLRFWICCQDNQTINGFEEAKDSGWHQFDNNLIQLKCWNLCLLSPSHPISGILFLSRQHSACPSSIYPWTFSMVFLFSYLPAQSLLYFVQIIHRGGMYMCTANHLSIASPKWSTWAVLLIYWLVMFTIIVTPEHTSALQALSTCSLLSL